MPEIKSFSRGLKAIKFCRVVNPNSENPAAPEEEQAITTHEAPLPELDEALAALKTVVCEVMGFQKDYAVDMTIYRFQVSYTKNGTRAVQLRFKKAIETIGGGLHPMATPFFKIDEPGDGESGKMEVKPKSAELVKTAIREAERYSNGERSQTLLNFDEAKAALNATAAIGAEGDMFAEAAN
jgi:hypothetical protein